MEGGKREKKKEEANPKSSSSTMANSVAFSDEIPNTNTSTSMSTAFSSYPFSPALSSIFDMMPPPPSSCEQKASSFGGFMDLLAVHDYTPSLFDWLPTTTTTATTSPAATTTIATQISHQPLPSPASSNVPDCSEVLNTPASPNSSSISSSSNEAANNNNIEEHNGGKVVGNEHEAEDEDGDGDGAKGEDQDKTKKQ